MEIALKTYQQLIILKLWQNPSSIVWLLIVGVVQIASEVDLLGLNYE
jgi:hypothetical protein